MFAPGSRSTAFAALSLAVCAVAALAETPMHQRKPVNLVSTVDAEYRMTQQGREIGSERFERRAYDDNRVVFDVSSSANLMGALFSYQSSLVLSDDSYFPQSFRSDRTIVQAADTIRISFTVDMVSNVAVVGSDMGGRTDSRHVVAPTGVPVIELGALYSWYQIVFWTDFTSRDRQRFQWIEPQKGSVESGELVVSQGEPIDVLGKKTPVSVLKVERERLGPATLYVDASRRIVRCEQNGTEFDLVKWSEK